MYKALYREYRPEVFEEMLGQEHIVKILRNQVESDSVNHAYLFCGTRGTGKTTTARLLAKAVNCLSEGVKPCGICDNCKAIKDGTFMDLIEIDAASNNGINDIRELRESVNFPPALGKKKVYIIDEVHMLSKEAFNGFLKTLEEPPENVMFILATTEPQKLPQTILSRCIRMDFRRVSELELADRMEEICKAKEIEIDSDAVKLVAANADGSVRDGLTLLEQCISGRSGKVSRAEVLDALGAVGEETYIDITGAIMRNDVSECILKLNEIFSAGKDARQILAGMINHYRNLLLIKYVKKPENVLNMSMENVQRVREQSDGLELAEINEAIILLSKTSGEMSYSTQPRVLLELAIVQLATGTVYYGKETQEKRPAGGRLIQETSNSGGTVNLSASGVSVKSAAVGASAMSSDHIGNTVAITEKKTPEEVEIQERSAATGADIGNDIKNMDMQEVWREVCDEAVGTNPMMMAVKKYTFPKKMTSGEMVIGVLNPTANMMMDKEKGRLTEILNKITGSEMHLTVAGESEIAENESIEKTAHMVEDMLGISVKIED